jgi:hypothetical protein
MGGERRGEEWLRDKGAKYLRLSVSGGVRVGVDSAHATEGALPSLELF